MCSVGAWLHLTRLGSAIDVRVVTGTPVDSVSLAANGRLEPSTSATAMALLVVTVVRERHLGSARRDPRLCKGREQACPNPSMVARCMATIHGLDSSVDSYQLFGVN